MSGAHHQHENAWAGQGAVLLDIGDDVGALVVTTPTSMVGVEVEIEETHTPGTAAAPDGAGACADGARPHVAVVARPTGGGTVPSLVFPELHEGRYALSVKPDGPVELVVEVRGGEVVTAHWPVA